MVAECCTLRDEITRKQAYLNWHRDGGEAGSLTNPDMLVKYCPAF